MASQRILYLSLIVATFAVSWAAILIKLSGAGPLPTAFYRVAIASVILAVPAIPRLRRSFKNISATDRLIMLSSGIALGLHFAVWITSLYYTTVSNSTILVATQPVFVLAMEALSGQEKIETRAVIGIALSLAGMIIISGGDINLGREYIIGDLLALAGAFLAGVYLFIGRKIRAKVDNFSYILPVYSISALTLLIICTISGVNMTDYPLRSWIFFLLLALIPTVIGHSLYNWLLEYVPAHKVATTILGEPIGATILAIFFLDQIPGWWTVIGGCLILLGIYIVLRKQHPKKLETGAPELP